MSIRVFSLAGYSHLYHTLLRFYPMSVSEVKSLVYHLNTANLDSARSMHPNMKLMECTQIAFNHYIEHSDCRPYRTEVQLYKALCALEKNIVKEALISDQREAVAQMRCIMGNLESRFYKAFGREIFDCLTVYDECVFGLVPWEDEPSVCMLFDWIMLPSA